MQIVNVEGQRDEDGARTLGGMLRTTKITRYVTPLPEGSSLPALVEADGGHECHESRGTGHGAKALIAGRWWSRAESDATSACRFPELVLLELPEMSRAADSS